MNSQFKIVIAYSMGYVQLKCLNSLVIFKYNTWVSGLILAF